MNLYTMENAKNLEDTEMSKRKGIEDTRPSWDKYFLQLAKDVSLRSNCSRRKVGAVIVKDTS